MNILLRQRAMKALAAAPLPVQKAFIKQMSFLVRDLRHPGLHVKKYVEAEDKWQGRINDDASILRSTATPTGSLT
jgi:hypothetical protein